MAFDWEKYGVTDARTGGSKADIQHNIDRLYQNVVGRNADPSGRAYWADKIGTGTNTYDTLLSGLTSSKEYKDRAAQVKANPNVTEAQLDMLPSAYVSAFHPGSGSAVAGWKPGDPITQAIANAVTTNTKNADGTTNTAANYSDQTNKTVFDVNKAHNVIDSTGGVGVIGGVTGTGANSNVNPTTTTGLTTADLDKWWKALDKPWLKQTTTSDGTDDFMKLMMFMSMMRPQGGGYGGGQYGYGGLNPGGVQSAYNPMANLSSYMDAFKTLPGISTSTISTGSN
tara:strand:+ start:517 stop:1365 length:849 start_codon:yes stop_codon:yes gene_type:complete